MSRVKRGVTNMLDIKSLKAAKGYTARRKLFGVALPEKASAYAYRDRRVKKK